MPDFSTYSVRLKKLWAFVCLNLQIVCLKAILRDSTKVTLHFDLHPEPLRSFRWMSDSLVGYSE